MSQEESVEGTGRLGNGRLRGLLAYGRETFGLDAAFAGVRDSRRQPETDPSTIAAIVFFCGLLRIRSFNALEPRLDERGFRRLLGDDTGGLCSVDTVSRSLCRMDVATVRKVFEGIVAQAERNKVFREGGHGALRYVAFDGWEPFSSYSRHCPDCLVRQIRVKQPDDSVVEVPQYYHRYAVAMMVDRRFDLALGIEPVLPNAKRPDGEAPGGEDEGELTATIRLLRRVKRTFPWVDVAVADGLYPNGPFLTAVQELGMGAVVIVRKETDEPLKEALTIWGASPPEEVIDVPREHADGRQLHGVERISLWDCKGIETLDTYRGPIRVVRAEIQDPEKPGDQRRTWIMAVTGRWPTARLTALKVLQVARGRWHIENTGFHQWTTRWKFAHVFVHNGNALLALFSLFFAAYNLLTLYLYRQVRSYGRDRGKCPTRTISRFIDELLDDLARLALPQDSS